MPTIVAYLTVVLVWATTPLAIKWSAEALPPVLSAMLRMQLAVVIGVPWLWLIGERLYWHRRALLGYAAALPGVFGAMALSYLASPHVPSGLISVVFGLAPLMSGLMVQAMPTGVRLNRWHWAGCIVGVAGLAVVFLPSLAVGNGMLTGLLLLLGAVLCFSITGVLVKHVAPSTHPLSHTVGALVVSLPFYALLCLANGESVVLGERPAGVFAILYLAVFGSLIGFVSYFVVLRRLSPATVSLITLMTPVLALLLGAWLNHEVPTLRVYAGAALIISALGLYFFGDRRQRLPAPVAGRGGQSGDVSGH